MTTTTVQGVPLASFVSQVAPQVTATPFTAGGTTARSAQARAQEVVNVKDFGAPGSAGGDSAPGINAAFAYVRGLGAGAAAKIAFPADTYTILSPINATGLQSPSILIEGSGSTLVGAFNGGIVFDFFDTRWLKLRDLYIISDGVHEPALGLAGGSIGTRVADNHAIENVFIEGNFSLACAYFIGTETSAARSLRCWNGDAGSGSYALIVDGVNHFGVSSTFAPQTMAADSFSTFNEMLFDQADARKPNGGHAIWIGGTSRHTWQASYVDCQTATQAVVLWASANNTNQTLTHLALDLHQETLACTDVFLVDGPNPAPVIQGLSYRDHRPQASSSIFRTAAQITSVNVQSISIDIAQVAQSPVLFANQAVWTISGTIISPSSTPLVNVLWEQFSGTILLPAGVDGSALTVVARTGETGRTLEQRAAETVNVKDFGAPGSAGGDSAPGINAAFAYVRGLGPTAAAKIVFPSDTYTVMSPINATGLQSPSIVIDGSGSTISGAFNGGIVFDFFDTRYMRLRDLFITNAAGFEPAIGIAGGNIGTRVADCHAIHDVMVSGNFSLACAYFTSTETSAAYNLKVWNGDAGSGSYALIDDACNHFGVSSTFAPQTRAADSAYSFNEMLFEQLDARKPNGGHAIWAGGGISRHRFISSYCDCQTATQAVVLWASAPNSAFGCNDTIFDMHVETSACTDAFLVDGAQNAPGIYGFSYRDHGPLWTNSAFTCAAHITSVTAQNFEIDCALDGSPQVFFAQPALWHITAGRLVSPNYAGAINTAALAHWTGTTNAGQVLTLTADTVTATQRSGGAATFTGLVQAEAGLTVSGGFFTALAGCEIGSVSAGYTQIVINAATGNARFLDIQTAGQTRWNIGANSDAESGGNTGSSFVLARFSDAGAFLDFPITVNRATGQVTLADALQVHGEAGFNGTAPIAKPTVTGAKGGNAALASLMTALAAYGLVTDSTTA